MQVRSAKGTFREPCQRSLPFLTLLAPIPQASLLNGVHLASKTWTSPLPAGHSIHAQGCLPRIAKSHSARLGLWHQKVWAYNAEDGRYTESCGGGQVGFRCEREGRSHKRREEDGPMMCGGLMVPHLLAREKEGRTTLAVQRSLHHLRRKPSTMYVHVNTRDLVW